MGTASRPALGALASNPRRCHHAPSRRFVLKPSIMPFPTWTPPPPDPSKPWTSPRAGDERRVPPPTEDAWWAAVQASDLDRVSAWLDGPPTYVYNDPRGALLCAKNAVGQTALGWLVENQDLAEAAVRLLPVLLAGNDTPMLGYHTVFTNLPPFWAALEHPDERVARTMWEHLGPDRVSSPCWVHDAVVAGVDERAIQRLLAWGLPVNERTAGRGNTALHAVFQSWNTVRFTGVLDLLLTAGADPRVSDRNGQTALGYAIGRTHADSSLEPVIPRLRRIAQQLDERDALRTVLSDPSLPAPADSSTTTRPRL